MEYAAVKAAQRAHAGPDPMVAAGLAAIYVCSNSKLEWFFSNF